MFKNKIKKSFFWIFLVDKRFIFFFEKDSRRGLLRFAHDPVIC